MFARVQKLIAKLVPNTVSHRWNLYKTVSAFTALTLVMAMLPVPQNLPQGQAAAFIVNTLTDDADAVPGDGICDSDIAPGLQCSLRAAIHEANQFSGNDTITFDGSILPAVFQPVTALEIFPVNSSDTLTITGTITGNVPQVTIDGSLQQVDSFSITCTNSLDSDQPAMFRMLSDGNEVTGLNFINAPGNAIEVLDADDNKISNNWIGTTDRITDPLNGSGSVEGNNLHGICVKAETEEVSGTEINGNIIVASGNDGIRLEGSYDQGTGERFPVRNTFVVSNLIGNLTGQDVNSPPTGAGFTFHPGNRYSGITARIADDNLVHRNVITNNGYRNQVDDDPLATADGITLLEANSSIIFENYIGNYQDFSAPIDSVFPWTIGNGGLDADNLLSIASIHPGDATDYSSAPNACDGVSIRFYDNEDVMTVEFNDVSDQVFCLDPDFLLPTKPSNDPDTFIAADNIGPSLGNKVFNNDIGYNLRNGVFIQTVACYPDFLNNQLPPFPNLPNAATGSGEVMHYIQSAQNSIVQNTIFRNDGSDTNGPEPTNLTNSGSLYGMGIDLEDFATASLTNDMSGIGNYWVQNFGDPPRFGTPPNPFGQCNTSFTTLTGVQPSSPSPSIAVDYNLNENDDYPADSDSGLDPDAGANRLQNFPIIDELASTPTAITGTAPEGSLVDLYQVICTNGSTSDVVPGTAQAIREDCDIDTWNSHTGTTPPDDVHTKGHGQGFRFLGNAYVAIDADLDHEGPWTINPADFDFLGDNFQDVATFSGGLITATATAVSTTFGSGDFGELCWDDGAASVCDQPVFPAGVSAQRAGSTGSEGLWAPPFIGTGCPNVSPDFPELVVYEDDPQGYLSCLGSTSEFSANAVVGGTATASGSYSLVKNISTPFGTTTVSSGDTVEYNIIVTNTGVNDIAVLADALDDTLPTSVTATACTWTKTAGSVPLAGLCNVSATPLAGVNFGVLAPGAKLIIVISTTVDSNLNPNECAFFNEVLVTGEPPISTESEIATESGSTMADHTTETLDVDPCGGGQTGSGSTLEKQVNVNGGAYADADSSATGPSANRGDPVNYLIHYGNQTGTGASVTISDIFPATLSLSGFTVTCWYNNIAVDTAFSFGDTLFPDCGYTGSSFDADDTVPGIQPFTVANGDYVHILVTGYSVFSNHPFPGGSICNKVDAHISAPVVEDLVDAACITILDPGIVVNKSALVPDSIPAGESSVNFPGPGPEVPVGAPMTYFIDVMNPTAGSILSNVRLFDTFAAELGAAGWTCTYDLTTVPPSSLTDHTGLYSNFCAINTITGEIDGGLPPPGGLNLTSTQVLHVRLTGRNVPVPTGTTLCNSVNVVADQNLSGQDSACIRPQTPNLSIIKTVDNSTPTPGSTVVYTLQVTNPGSTPALNVVITDDLDDASVGTPLITTCVSGMANITPLDGGISDLINNAVSWNIGTLSAGETRNVRLSAVLRADISGTVNCRNVAIAGGSNVPSVNDDATIIIPTQVPGGGLIDFSKVATNDGGDDVEPDVFEPGDTVRYRVTIRNTGTGPAAGLSLRDSIPEEEEDLRNAIATSGVVNPTELTNDNLLVESIGVAAGDSETVDYDVSVLDENDFPLDNYDLDSGADQEDDDFYPEDVEDDDIGTNSTYDDAEDALGSPDGHFVSLGEDGEVVVSTSDEDDDQGKLIVDGDGDDFCVVEVDPTVDSDGSTEEYEVEVSQTSDEDDFESVGHSTSNTDCFDIEDADMTWARFVRIVDTSGSVRGNAPGSDIDAVCLLNLGGFVTNVASLFNGSTLIGTREERVLVNFTDAFDDPLSDNDCEPVPEREPRVPAPTPTPLPPPPVVIPPVVHYPRVELPKTGPETAAVPFVMSGVLGMIAWVMKRRRK